jgi:hypothetical protein
MTGAAGTPGEFDCCFCWAGDSGRVLLLNGWPKLSLASLIVRLSGGRASRARLVWMHATQRRYLTRQQQQQQQQQQHNRWLQHCKGTTASH